MPAKSLEAIANQRAAQVKWHAENKERIAIDVPIGKKAEYMAAAKERGLSMSAYIVRLIEADMSKGE